MVTFFCLVSMDQLPSEQEQKDIFQAYLNQEFEKMKNCTLLWAKTYSALEPKIKELQERLTKTLFEFAPLLNEIAQQRLNIRTIDNIQESDTNKFENLKDLCHKAVFDPLNSTMLMLYVLQDNTRVFERALNTLDFSKQPKDFRHDLVSLVADKMNHSSMDVKSTTSTRAEDIRSVEEENKEELAIWVVPSLTDMWVGDEQTLDPTDT